VPVVSLYVLETVFHLGAVVDADALHEGGAAPVAFATSRSVSCCTR
jgi:hypothetical protein